MDDSNEDIVHVFATVVYLAMMDTGYNTHCWIAIFNLKLGYIEYVYNI